MERIRVLIADDEATVREALADLLSSDASIDVIGTAADADQAIEIAGVERPNVALLDVRMPAGGGSRAAREIRRLSPGTHVIALSAYEDRRTVLDMLRAGAVGYLVKGASSGEILDTIRETTRSGSAPAIRVGVDVIRDLVGLLDRSEALAGELLDLDGMKSELIEAFAADLLTTAAEIQGLARTATERGDALRADEMRELADAIARGSARLRRVAGNLAATARMSREGVGLSVGPVSVTDLLREAVAEFPQEAHRLRLPAKPTTASLLVDERLAARAIVMALQDALDRSPPDEPVEVGVTLRGTEAEIVVADRGPDPSAPDDPSPSAASAASAAGPEPLGNGAELGFARRIVRAHGGRTDQLPRPGGGRIVVLSFPAFGGAEVTP